MEIADYIQKKIFRSYNEIEFSRLLAYYRFKDYRIVFTNGCFDIIHRAHVEYLLQASTEGDVLIVGLNSDESVKRIKGKNRPINDEYSRALVLASMLVVSNVVIFNEETPLELIKIIRPHVIVKGGDYKENEIIGADFVKSYGGKVKIVPYIEGFSTSKIINEFLVN
ncbi:MAG: D-glycero-beta-D-manno-heptose 1-phosphate adenylyltransferase [Bacteroidales bacterium]|nr:D-glycero-beta-D-manno-heptose 1-phosphate adenylyltransferase [Bacteroidales bacterium]